MVIANKTKIFLPADYTPHPHDVICAKGKNAFTHPGNRRFRLIVDLCLSSYQFAKTKTEKSIIVSGIIDKGGSASRFIRFDRKTGLYYDIGEEATREKVGQTLREALIQNDPEKKERKKNQRAVTKAKRKQKDVSEAVEMVSNSLVIPSRRRSLRIMKRDSLSGVDKALAAMPPTLQFASSHAWFDNESTTDESLGESVLSGEDLDSFFTSPTLIVSSAVAV